MPRLLAVAEVALALLLSIGAGLLMKSFVRLANVDLGFRPENVLTMRLSLRDRRLSEPARAAVLGAIVDRVRTLPDVSEVGATKELPLVLTLPMRLEVRDDQRSSAVAPLAAPGASTGPVAEYGTGQPDATRAGDSHRRGARADS